MKFFSSCKCFTLALSIRGVVGELSCGVSNGYDLGTKAYYYNDKGDLANFDACSAACKADSKCQSFAFGNTACLLYAEKITTNFREQSNSPYVFYDRDCHYVQPTFTPAPPPASTPTPSNPPPSNPSPSDSNQAPGGGGGGGGGGGSSAGSSSESPTPAESGNNAPAQSSSAGAGAGAGAGDAPKGSDATSSSALPTTLLPMNASLQSSSPSSISSAAASPSASKSTSSSGSSTTSTSSTESGSSQSSGGGDDPNSASIPSTELTWSIMLALSSILATLV